jgi:hypothetical protein
LDERVHDPSSLDQLDQGKENLGRPRVLGVEFEARQGVRAPIDCALAGCDRVWDHQAWSTS